MNRSTSAVTLVYDRAFDKQKQKFNFVILQTIHQYLPHKHLSVSTKHVHVKLVSQKKVISLNKR